MIFVTSANGDVTYVSPEWNTYTGQATDQAVGRGWFQCIHSDDHDTAVKFFNNAREQRSEFSLRLRLRLADESYAWVVIGAVPSFGPPDVTFLGYLGSLTEIGPSGTEQMTTYGTLERFAPPPSNFKTPPGTPLELVADHLLMAHSLIEGDGAKEMLPVLKQALLLAGRLLAKSMDDHDPKDNFH